MRGRKCILRTSSKGRTGKGGRECRNKASLYNSEGVRVRRVTPQAHRLEVQKYVEITLNVNKEATPFEVWRKMQQGRDKFFADTLKLVMGDLAPHFLKGTTALTRGRMRPDDNKSTAC